MITDSDGHAYEDEVAHALDVKMDLSQGASAQGKKMPDKQPDKIQNELDTQSNYDYWTQQDPEMIPSIAFGMKGVMPKTSDLEDVPPSERITDREHPTIKGLTLESESPANSEISKMSEDLGYNDLPALFDRIHKQGTDEIKQKMEHFKKMWQEIPVPMHAMADSPFERTRPDAGGAASPIPEFTNNVITTAATMQAEPTPKKTGPPMTTNRGKIPRHKVEE